jgi:lipopolysaccharide/colanic/teichoic acid biosynthesis glycosyltransferase
VTQRGYRLAASLSFEPKIQEKFAGGVLAAEPPVARSRWLDAIHPWRKSAGAAARVRAKAAARNFPRRAFDAACSAVGLAILAPLFAMIALAIKLDDGGPIFYSQPRVGRGLRRFRVLKFRSMRSNSAGGCLLTSPQDARVTRVGAFLRRYKLDELPQLANVLRGEMQLVGVRPQVEKFVDFYRDEYEELLRTAPGITDVSSLIFRDEARFFYQGSIEEQYIKRILPIKLEMSLKYARTRTFFSDLGILFRTVLGLPCPHTAWEGTKFDPAAQSLPDFISKNIS